MIGDGPEPALWVAPPSIQQDKRVANAHATLEGVVNHVCLWGEIFDLCCSAAPFRSACIISAITGFFLFVDRLHD